MKCYILWISNRRVTNLMTSSRLCIAQLDANTNLIVNCVLKHLKDIKHILRECLNDNMSSAAGSVSDGIILWPYHISNITSNPETRPIVSFNRIFNSSMLSRSKEYRLQRQLILILNCRSRTSLIKFSYQKYKPPYFVDKSSERKTKSVDGRGNDSGAMPDLPHPFLVIALPVPASESPLSPGPGHSVACICCECCAISPSTNKSGDQRSVVLLKQPSLGQTQSPVSCAVHRPEP